MDTNLNVPSIEEISFKLTENLIPSNVLIPLRLLSDSLDYTHSRLSIQMFLGQEEIQASPTQRQTQHSPNEKLSLLKTTCADLIGQESFKKTTKPFFRQRIFSYKVKSLQPINRRASLHVMNLGASVPLTNPQTPRQHNLEAPLHSPHPAPYRSRSNSRKKIANGKQNIASRRVGQSELQQLQNSIKVRAVALESHEIRQKAFMRRMIQNRSKVVHAVEEISRYPSLLSARRTARIQ